MLKTSLKILGLIYRIEKRAKIGTKPPKRSWVLFEIETFVNAVKSVQLSVPTPSGYGITGVELVYKETQSGVLYVVEDKSITTESLTTFFYKSQDPFKTLPGDQLTRIYDAVPRKAKSQELAGGRLVYGNFLQNFDIPDISFSVARTGETSARYTALDDNMSVKSRRTYQVGIVLADKFGRQSPVILSSTGNDTVFIDAGSGASDSTNVFNALRVSFSQATVETLQELDWAYSYRIVVKQREQEYYNWISIVSGANTVARLVGVLEFDKLAITPGLALAAAQPQTELTIIKVVPFFSIKSSTSFSENNSLKPLAVNCSLIGLINSAGYIFIFYKFVNNIECFLCKILILVLVIKNLKVIYNFRF